MQYIKIKETIAEQIAQGMLSAGQKLPSERQLAETFATTRVTLREALSLLETEGLIYREDRRGWFIAPPRINFPLSAAEDFLALAEKQSRQASVSVIRAKNTLANKQVSGWLQLGPFAEVYAVEMLRYLEKRPVCLVRYWVHAEKHAAINADAPEELFAWLCQRESQHSLDVSDSVTIGCLTGETAIMLHAAPGTPAIVIERKVYCGGHPVAAEIAVWRHDTLTVTSNAEHSSR
ncbi:Putative transcriptional regulator of 2-aminoethylphosphonate degradation operons [Vibrio ruber DSM 16370]|uniref:Putative transcriptional regulator of 2-aminoethylphosphonate degradation operons n=1 Tax=Vibrio ruber (strain DSM 16370 / JCM 11486 / BCRC 17186 / CECT 7878 / LMG 23124 / VR1) TaxID=1123498 RepID=A0A1R4LTH7_VIBR1|nr:GntR family transcriptional regulator [Vibrio ruber]SJN59689.1 Putative transcriptional regulator of 2-aminoethylphosphonate degradation operons [Vibrio ruber DSM 16370]